VVNVSALDMAVRRGLALGLGGGTVLVVLDVVLVFFRKSCRP
jgi:hypothetical protein